MVFHDYDIQVLQFERSGARFKMLGFNEVALTEGLIKDGKILNLDAFKDVLADLFSQATPEAIQTKSLLVNVPSELLYTFVQDFSHHSDEAALNTSILETVRGHFPFAVEDLAMDFDSVENGHQVSYAVYGSLKKWQERFMRVCKKIGISSVDFIPEPIAQLALHEDTMTENAALFSNHQGEIFLSLFHNGLLYDTYFLGQMNMEGLKSGLDCGLEFKSAQKDFLGRFNVPLKTIYFVGFEKEYHKEIRKHFNESDESLVFLAPRHSKLGELIPYGIDKSTLFGLFNMVVSKEDHNFRK